MGDASSSTDPASGLAGVCSEAAGLLRERWGRGPQRVRALWAGSDVLVLLHDDGPTRAEATLRAAGQATEVAETRRALHAFLEQELCDIVRRHTGRQVTTMLCATRLDPDLSADLFLLEPRQRPPLSAG